MSQRRQHRSDPIAVGRACWRATARSVFATVLFLLDMLSLEVNTPRKFGHSSDAEYPWPRLKKFEKNDSIRRLGLHLKYRGFCLQGGPNAREGRASQRSQRPPLLQRRASSRSLSGNTRFAHICSCSFARGLCILVVFSEPVCIRRCSSGDLLYLL